MKNNSLTHQTNYLLGALLVSAVLAIGCTRSSLRDISFFRTQQSNESFEQLSKSDPVTLTIWHNSMKEAQAISRESGKPILADFTGSDWCGWCIKLKKDVFKTEEFKSWARDNVVLLELDYPKRSMQTVAIRTQNSELKDRYNINSYPTVLLLDADGEVLGKLGYMASPSEWIDAAESQLAN